MKHLSSKLPYLNYLPIIYDISSIRLLLLISILLGASGCATSPYHVISPLSYPAVSQQLPQRKIILLGGNQLEEAQTKELISLLDRQQWEVLRSRIYTVSDLPTRRFVQAIAWLLQKEYESAYQTLSKLPDTAFDCQVHILKTDCEYEMRLVSTGDLQQSYQQARDCSENPSIQSIANTRYRFIKYDY